MNAWHWPSGPRLVAILAVATLWGCATGSHEHKEGLALLDQGRYEEGLAKLDQATRLGPDELSFRTTLLTQRERVISRLLAEAETARRNHQQDTARARYEQMLRLDPYNTPAASGLRSLDADRRHDTIIQQSLDAFNNGNVDAARASLKPVLLENPANDEAQALLRRLDEKASGEEPSGATLRATFKRPVSLQFRDANLKLVFEALSRTSGINVLLDKDVKSDAKTSIYWRKRSSATTRCSSIRTRRPSSRTTRT
jgi:general secretion pathway protein D